MELPLKFLLPLLLLAALIRPFSSELCHPQDKQVLLQIKKAFNDPYVLSSWDPTTDCCEWYCVECDITSHRIVSLIIMDDKAISGPIPPQVGDLPYLTNLEFHKLPNITGPIPPAIAKLTSLNLLRLYWTNISGPVPTFIGQLKNLSVLELSFNNLSGLIPSSISSLPNLAALHLDRNNLTGPIPISFSLLSNLDVFNVAYNRLCGPIPVGGKLQSFDTTFYFHNKCLCGAPLPACN